MPTPTRHRWRSRPRAVVLAAALVAATLLATGTTAGAAGVRGTTASETSSRPEGRRTHTGTIDGAAYRVEMPERWNGTLVLYSHGYIPRQVTVEGVAVTNNADTEPWLLDHGFALAASNYRDPYGFQVPRGQHDQLALLDWFEDNVGSPQRTISMGQSMGGSIAVQLAERHPQRFDGVVGLCSLYDTQGTWNAGLDIAHAVRTLLLPDDVAEDIELVHPRSIDDATADSAVLQQAVQAAADTPVGRARLALIASLNNITGWWRAHERAPTDPVERIRQQANWIANAYVAGSTGPLAHVDLEATLGGNPSTNVGIDYRHQLARSAQTRLVGDAYRAAGLGHGGLDDDLDRLNAGPRIAPDQPALEHIHRTSVPSGRLPVPMVSLHTTGDGGVVPDHERWYAEQVHRQANPNLLRQLYIERGQHCSFSAADEVTALQTVLRRIDAGRWPNTNPGHLDRAVRQFEAPYQQVYDMGAGQWPAPARVMPPAFVPYQPPRFLRPSL